MKKKNILMLVVVIFGLASISMAQTIPSYVPTNGLVGWWPFTGNANDLSVNGNNGTVNGAILTADRFGVSNSAYSFDGSSRIDIGALNNQIGNPNSSWSVNCWFKSLGSQNGDMVMVSDYSSNSGGDQVVSTWLALWSYTFNNKVGSTIRNTPNGWDALSTNSYNDNQWHSMVSVSEFGLLKIYIDGILINTINYNSNTNFLGSPYFRFGALLFNGQLDSYFQGQLDDIGIWNRALTQQEITDLYIDTAAAAGPIATITTTNNTICSGQSTTITATVNNAGTSCTNMGLPPSLNNGNFGYWPFCGDAIDASGNGNNGTVNGATLTADRFGVVNSAYSFDGTSNKIIAGSSSALNPGIADFSISGWIKTTDASGIICSKSLGDSQQNPQNNDWYVIHVNSGKLEFELTDGYSGPGDYVLLQSTITINDGAFHFFAFVFDRDGNGSIYIDNVLNNSTSISGFQGDISPLTHLEFGYDTEHITNYLSGVLDDINYWSRTLNPQEITQLYTNGLPTYLWSNGATTTNISVSPITTTNYTCTISMNGATTTQNQTIIVNYSPTTPVVSVTNDVDLSTTVQLNSSYQWILCSDNTNVPGATTNNYTATSNGIYGVIVSNTCGADTSNCINIDNIGLNENLKESIIIYPNPSFSYIKIMGLNTVGSDFEVRDGQGRILKIGNVSSTNSIIDLGSFEAGIYWVNIKGIGVYELVKE